MEAKELRINNIVLDDLGNYVVIEEIKRDNENTYAYNEAMTDLKFFETLCMVFIIFIFLILLSKRQD